MKSRTGNRKGIGVEMKNGGKGLERRTGNGFEEKEGNMD